MLNVFHCYTNHLLFYASFLAVVYTIELLLVLIRALLSCSFLLIPTLFYITWANKCINHWRSKTCEIQRNGHRLVGIQRVRKWHIRNVVDTTDYLKSCYHPCAPITLAKNDSHVSTAKKTQVTWWLSTALGHGKTFFQGKFPRCWRNKDLIAAFSATTVLYLYLHKLKRIQNSLARIVTGKHRHEHITLVLARLQWLPVKYRVHFKLAVITFNALTRQQPSYLAELLSVHVPRRDLRSGNYQRLLIPKNKLKFTDSATQHRPFGMDFLLQLLPLVHWNISNCHSKLNCTFVRLTETDLWPPAL